MLENLVGFAIDCIIDTRNIDDDRKPIPGSGEPWACDCCGRTIEIHAHIYNRKTKVHAIIGTQCAKRAKMKNGGAEYSPDNQGHWISKANGHRYGTSSIEHMRRFAR